MPKLPLALCVLACLATGGAFAAVPDLPRSIESAPRVPDRAQLNNLYLAACLAHMAMGQADKAEIECGKAIALDPKSATAYKLRGYGYLITRRFERAEADFQVALRLRPGDVESRAGLGQSFSGMGEYQKAVDQFALTVKQAPAMAAYHNGLCWARAGTGRHLDLALADCNRALKLAPGAPGILNSRGLVLLRMARYPEALADYNASLAARDAQPTARFGRGLLLLRLGKKSEGAADIVLARSGDGDVDMLFVRLGLLPRSCAEQAKACPAGFPASAKRPARSYPWLVVSLHGEADQDYVLAIEARRLDVMVAQTALLLGRKETISAEPPQTHQEIMDRLAQTVRLFNRLLPQACATGRIPSQNCRSFHPRWTGRTDPALAVEQAYQHITPVWAGLCAGRAQRCPIE